ncbi:MAG TPA: cyclic nucleotide-binding domain-containing protein [Solirubrobacteraceae bacterium]|nr:cyclic nucleotide-binding domain-containing protein [Solirubrobacteraceae bacterium]
MGPDGKPAIADRDRSAPGRRVGPISRVRGVVRIVGSNGALSRLMLAFLVMTFVEYGEWIALLVYAYKRGGASTAGLVALAQLIPSMVLAPIISAHGARIGIARLLACCYLASTLMLAGCAVAILLNAHAVVVYAAAVGFTVPLGVSIPLHNVLTPLVVRHPDELTAANVATAWCKGAGALGGPLLAGLMIGLQGPGLACAVLAGMCACTPLLARVHPLRAAAHGGEEEEGGLADLIAAARVIAAQPNTRALMAYRAGAAAIEGAIDLLVVLIAIRILVIGPAAAGYLSAAFGAGGLAGASLAVLLVGRRLAVPLVAAALIGAAALAALTLASTTLLAVTLLLVVGASRSMQSIAAQTLLQRSTPLDVIVCAFVLIESIRDAGLAFGSLAVPLLVSLGGTDAAFLGMASLAPLAVILTLPRIRSIDREASIPVVEMGLLRNLHIFSALPAAPLETLAREACYLTFPAGATVISEGEVGDRYYAITDGDVVVSRGGSKIRRMGRGEGFGEIALLHRVRRTATVTAASATTFLSIEQDAFLAALNASTHVREAAGRVAERLLAVPE